MILLREIQFQDLDALEKFAQIPGFINLTTDRDALREKLARSQQSFKDPNIDITEGKYIFVAVDTETHKVVGTSMIAAQHGTAESPHFYLQVGSEEKYSETINTGFIHGTLELKFDTNGPSEIGGLVLDPDYRKSESRMGRQISFVRFLYLAKNRARFKDRVIAELLPPLNKRGQSPLWEAIGRRFTNMDYWEADQLCQKNKEFIFSLFPTGKIYTSFLAAEARNAIGKVGKDTEPVVHMLKKIGFKYQQQVDPFDGGPHLWADVKELVPVQKMQELKYGGRLSTLPATKPEVGLLTQVEQEPGSFRAVNVEAWIENGEIKISAEQPKDIESLLSLAPGQAVNFMPYY